MAYVQSLTYNSLYTSINPAMHSEFWKYKQLDELDHDEWEALCDGCGRCCLHKLEDEDSGEYYYTNVACRLLDRRSCRCSDYPGRKAQVPDCISLTPANVANPAWLPSTCAYRLLAEGRPLFDWHPLISGDPDSVHRSGNSGRGRIILETEIDDELQYHLVDWAG